MTIGTDGSVSELDAYHSITGQDVNGGVFGTSAQLSLLPAAGWFGFCLQYGIVRGHDRSALELPHLPTTLAPTWRTSLSLSYLDVDIDSGINGTANESANTFGSLASGQNYQVDDPSGALPAILDNLLLGSLDDTNSAAELSIDVAMAMSWSLGTLLTGEEVIVGVLIAEDATTLGPFAITHFDSDPNWQTMITDSGAIRTPSTAPEPSALALRVSGLLIDPVEVTARTNTRIGSASDLLLLSVKSFVYSVIATSRRSDYYYFKVGNPVPR